MAVATEVISECGAGVSACHNLLAMEVPGLPGAALYGDSWSERCRSRVRTLARKRDALPSDRVALAQSCRCE